MSYLNNAWYVAAWGNEITEEFFTRTLLDIPILFYRCEDNQIVAMHDLCPHRFAPLSTGEMVDGAVRCGYHGLSFNKDGQCVKSLFTKNPPKAAKVRTFVTHEKDELIWIWMGDKEKADVSVIPTYSFHTDPEMRCQSGYTMAKSDYRLLSDNLMDLTHVALIHPSFGGLDYLPKVKTWEDGNDVICQFIVEHMPTFTDDKPGFVHNNDEIRWVSPANHYLESRVTPEEAPEHQLFIPSAHLLTPETRKTTHYFWSSAFHKDTPISDEDMQAQLQHAFDVEDKPMLEAVQNRMGDNNIWDLNPILLASDAGPVRVRRLLEASIKVEQQESAKAKT